MFVYFLGGPLHDQTREVSEPYDRIEHFDGRDFHTYQPLSYFSPMWNASGVLQVHLPVYRVLSSGVIADDLDMPRVYERALSMTRTDHHVDRCRR